MNVTKNFWINPQEISSMILSETEVDQRLFIFMKNGQEHIILHGDANIYKVKKDLEEAIKGSNNVLLENHDK